MIRPQLLVILDGFGYSPNQSNNAIAKAHTPFLDMVTSHYPSTLLHASGVYVGLPEHVCGNSQVGHLTIGAGRIVKQSLTLLLENINSHQFNNNSVLVDSLEQLKMGSSVLHIMGILSDAGVHGHEAILYACIEACYKQGIRKICLHIFLDGRDVGIKSAAYYLNRLEKYINKYPGVVIASLHGRWYAMDRDCNWSRTQKSYQVLTEKQSAVAHTWQDALSDAYKRFETDEFIQPIQLLHGDIIKDGDGIIFCNIRPDRAVQLTRACIDKDFIGFKRRQLSLSFFITPISYGTLKTKALFSRPFINNTLKDMLSDHKKTIFSIAETEKYAHVTYFFNGERQGAVENEKQLLVPSLKVASYQDYPEMSAPIITHNVIESLKKHPYDFYLINYANADMVGHSGNFSATINAVECLDLQLRSLYQQSVIKMNGTMYITADHGKAEDMFDMSSGQVHTGHTTNKVPFMMINQQYYNQPFHLPLTQLADIAPFILHRFGIVAPDEMQR